MSEVPLMVVVRWNGAESASFTALYRRNEPSGGVMRWIHNNSNRNIDDSTAPNQVRLVVPIGQSIVRLPVGVILVTDN